LNIPKRSRGGFRGGPKGLQHPLLMNKNGIIEEQIKWGDDHITYTAPPLLGCWIAPPLKN